MPRIIWMLLLGGGSGGLLVLFPLALGGLEWIVNFGVGKQLRIIKGSDTFEIWRVPPVPIYMRLRIFNITNPEDIKFGAKPILDELGPYVYLETLEKVNITVDEATDTLRYDNIHRYYFQPQMSSGSDEDVITFINIPFVAVAKMAHDFTDVEFMLETLDSMLSEKGETLVKTHTVREFMFDGFSVQAFLDLLKDPMVEAAGEVHVPEMIADGKMGLFKGKNGSSDGNWVVLSGKSNSKDLTRIQSYNGKKAMTVWKGESCNAINGTDGMMHRPFLTTETPLELFIPQMCRTLRYEYAGNVEYQGINAFKYKMAPSIYQSIEKNPDNWCFCPEKNSSKCDTTSNGIMSIAPCVEGAPLVISQPHFLDADPKFREGVEGMRPNEHDHPGHVIIHPKTAATLEAKHRFQFNMQLQQWPAMPTFANVTTVLLPLMWVQEGANIDAKNQGLIKLLETSLSIWSILKWLLIMFCGLSLGAGGFLMMQYNKSNQAQVIEKVKPAE